MFLGVLTETFNLKSGLAVLIVWISFIAIAFIYFEIHELLITKKILSDYFKSVITEIRKKFRKSFFIL